jgi:hypothetical protein
MIRSSGSKSAYGGPAVDIADESFVVAPPAEVAAWFADRRVWREWWPDLELSVVHDRGVKGIRWSVAGPLNGSAEIWLEPWHDGTIVHWFLRADPTGRNAARSAARAGRTQRTYVIDYKRRLHRLKDRLERDRPVGAPGSGAGR